MKTEQAYVNLIRATVFGLVFALGVIALCAEPDDASTAWFGQFVISKAIAAAAFYSFYKLIRRWNMAKSLATVDEDQDY